MVKVAGTIASAPYMTLNIVVSLPCTVFDA